MQLIDNVKSKLPNNWNLSTTTYLMYIKNQEVRDQCRLLYKHNKIENKIFGTVLNAIFKEGKSTFWLGRSSLTKLLAQDKNNNKNNTVNGSLWVDCIIHWTSCGWIEQIHKSGTIYINKKRINHPGCYRIIHTDILQAFDKLLVSSWRALLDEKANEKWNTLYKNNDLHASNPEENPHKDKGKDKGKEKPTLPLFKIKEKGSIPDSDITIPDLSFREVVTLWLSETDGQFSKQHIPHLFQLLSYYGISRQSCNVHTFLDMTVRKLKKRNTKWSADLTDQFNQATMRQYIQVPNLAAPQPIKDINIYDEEDDNHQQLMAILRKNQRKEATNE